jgi:hypothetical protein
MKNALIACLLLMGLSTTMKAQVEPRADVHDYIDAYLGTNARPYIQPLVDLVTGNINTGVYDWSGIPDKFYVKVKLNGMLSIPTDEMRTFTGRTSGDFTPETSVLAPTIIGGEESIVLTGANNSVYVFPGGYDLNQLALGTPQITLGGFMNSEITGRFLTFPLSDNEKINFYGIGGRHSLSNYFVDPPFDVSVGFMYHHIDAEDYLSSNMRLWNVMVGKSGEIFSGHLGVGYQNSNHHIHYVYEEDGDQTIVDMDLKNSNEWQLEGGVGAKLGPVQLNGAISYSKFATFALGAGLSF